MVKSEKDGLGVALICASNQNRSMEAHALFEEGGFSYVKSFGTGTKVRLPGPSLDKPNVYNFGTPYREIYDDLYLKDSRLYRANGLLSMLERNMKIKGAPEKWQQNKVHFDVVFTFEERVFDSVIEDITNRRNGCQVTHVFNVDTKDNAEEARVGASQAFSFFEMLLSSQDWEDNLDPILDHFATTVRMNAKPILHHIAFW